MSAVFGFRLPDDLRQYLQRKAEQYRTTISHYLIMLILRDMRNERGENINAKKI